MNAGFPYEERNSETWRGSRQVLAHALAAASHAELLAEGIEVVGRLPNQAGCYLETVAEFEQAKACYDPYVVLVRNNLRVLQGQADRGSA